MAWKRFGARGGPGDRSRGPVWRGVDGPVTITLPMAVHTLGSIVTGQERPTGGGGVEERRVEGCKKRALPAAAMGCPLLLSLFACPSPSSLTPSIIVHAAPWNESGSCRRTKRVEGEVPEPKRGLHQVTREEEEEGGGGGGVDGTKTSASARAGRCSHCEHISEVYHIRK